MGSNIDAANLVVEITDMYGLCGRSYVSVFFSSCESLGEQSST